MSGSEDQGGAGRREVAYRLFASEFDDADFSYSESDEERAPNYVVTPTGARVNRVFVVGVLTEVETVSEDYLRARIVDPSGPFVVYAGQYQPEALAFLESADPPTFVAVTGKARTYQPEDSDQVYTSIRPESISEVDAATRDRWVVQTAQQTVDRVARAAEAKASGLSGDDLRAALTDHGLDEGLAAGIPMALERYGTTGDYLAAVRDLALDATRVVAGEQDEVEPLTVLPDQGGDDLLASLVERPIDYEATAETERDESTPDVDATPSATETADDNRVGTAEASTDTATTASTDDAGSESATTASDDVTAAESETTDAPTAAAGTAGTDMSEGTAAESSDSGSAAESSVDASETASTESTVDSDEESGDAVSETTDTVETTTADEQSTEDEASGPSTDASATDDGDDLGDFDPEFELDENEREEIESEFGTEFQSGTEVDEPGSADIETPDPEEIEAAEEGASETTPEAESAEETEAVEADTDADAGTATEVATETAAETPADDSDDEPAADVDVEDAVMDAMADLDDGDGADRETIVDAVVDRTGSDPGAVEDAIQDALMGGRCYEPDDGVLKPI